MTKEEQKEKYRACITKISEILGFNKPIDILELCMVLDNFLIPYQERIAELENENAELKEQIK